MATIQRATVEAIPDGAAVAERWTGADWLSAHPGKRATERFWLRYTPVWGALAGAVMLSGLADRWTDAQLIPFALVLAAGAALGPLVWRDASERGLPLRQTAAAKLVAAVVALSFLLNYSQTP
jgi:hypothetical protein